MPLMVASSEAIAACDDKAQTVALAERAGVTVPRTHLARTPEEFRAAAAELGYPEREICMKPPQAKGSRGFRVLSATVDRRYALLEARPGPLPLSVDEALEAIGDEDFPPLLVMELATGKEHTVDGDLPRRPARARPCEDARGDARRSRHVLRDRCAAGARGGRAAPRARSCAWTGS